MRFEILIVALMVLVGCRSEPAGLPEIASHSAAVTKSEIEITKGVVATDVELSRAFDGLTQVRVRFVNRTAAPVQWSAIRDVDVALTRPLGRALLTAGSPGKVKPIIVPARSEARVTFLFDAEALDATSLSLFGRTIALGRKS